jgi:hypothetical protein
MTFCLCYQIKFNGKEVKITWIKATTLFRPSNPNKIWYFGLRTTHIHCRSEAWFCMLWCDQKLQMQFFWLLFVFVVFFFFEGACKWHHDFRYLEKVAHTAVYSSWDSGSRVKFQKNGNFSYVALTARHYLIFLIIMI